MTTIRAHRPSSNLRGAVLASLLALAGLSDAQATDGASAPLLMSGIDSTIVSPESSPSSSSSAVCISLRSAGEVNAVSSSTNSSGWPSPSRPATSGLSGAASTRCTQLSMPGCHT